MNFLNIPERIITEELNLKIYHLRRTPLFRVQPVTAMKETEKTYEFTDTEEIFLNVSTEKIKI